MNDDTISRQAALDAIKKLEKPAPTAQHLSAIFDCEDTIKALPSAQPFQNITMNDVLKYIDRMPEDVWQEFTACLECRGWELQRRTAKWCGSEFA